MTNEQVSCYMFFRHKLLIQNTHSLRINFIHYTLNNNSEHLRKNHRMLAGYQLYHIEIKLSHQANIMLPRYYPNTHFNIGIEESYVILYLNYYHNWYNDFVQTFYFNKIL